MIPGTIIRLVTIICDLLCAQGQKKQGRNERKSIMEEKKQQKEEEKLIATIKVCIMQYSDGV